MYRPLSLWLSILSVGLLTLVVNLSAGEPVSIPACIHYRLTAPAMCERCEWEVPDSDVEVFPGSGKVAGSIVIWVPSPRRLPIVRRVTGKDGKMAADLIDLKVTGEHPVPSPVKPVAPDPAKPEPVKPQPDATDTRPFSQRVTSEAMKIKSTNRAAEAASVIESFKSVRSQIVAGGVNTTEPPYVLYVIVQKMKTWPPNWKPWQSWWGIHGRQEFEKSGKMTPGNWLDLIDATIEGLSAVK